MHNWSLIPRRGSGNETRILTAFPFDVVFVSHMECCHGELFPSVMYSERVPSGGPPSFGGRLIRYSYKVAIGAQKPNCPAQIIRIPFRLMTIPGECLYQAVDTVNQYGPLPASMAPSPPVWPPPRQYGLLPASMAPSPPVWPPPCSPFPESLCNTHVAPSPKDANPFLAAEEVKEDPSLELALQALAAETSRRTSSEWRKEEGTPFTPAVKASL